MKLVLTGIGQNTHKFADMQETIERMVGLYRGSSPVPENLQKTSSGCASWVSYQLSGWLRTNL